MQARKIYWPAALSLAPNGYLYCMTNQLQRQADYLNGRDIRRKVYERGRIQVNSKLVALSGVEVSQLCARHFHFPVGSSIYHAS